MKYSLSSLVKRVAYNILRDPLYTQIEKAMGLAESGSFVRAKALLTQVEKNLRDKVRHYGEYPKLKEMLPVIQKQYNDVAQMVGGSDSRAVPAMKELLEKLKEAGPEIDRYQLVHTGP